MYAKSATCLSANTPAIHDLGGKGPASGFELESIASHKKALTKGTHGRCDPRVWEKRFSRRVISYKTAKREKTLQLR
ncbi:MAG: hypothetical protein Aurels2KO_17760 [Aureliella sp.]